ncbi:hypothetical protein F2Q69_00036355 [Brassica cretica]|uniref:RNA-polymerase II-associated protein 3-like C-terminal domain-containing protein n=1 Tax=Brassica cretica TaxID=69181 RepID=A0A8S9SPP1_BRACR|nr:hypothetical protein F2Q69_00036355 [Brassica cretica]
MTRSPDKHGRDQAQGFLNNLQDWELSLKDKDKKMKHQPSTSSSNLEAAARSSVAAARASRAAGGWLRRRWSSGGLRRRRRRGSAQAGLRLLSLLWLNLRETSPFISNGRGAKTNGDTARPVSGSKEVSGKKLIESVQPEEKKNEVSKKMTLKSQGYEKEAKSYGINGTQPSGSGNQVSRKLEPKPSVQELAARAASLAMAEVSKNVRVPKSAYEFENSWRSFSGDRALQTQLLKVTTPSSLPQIFKSALTSPVLFDIIKCPASFFNEDMDFAVKYIENLTKVPRFNMIAMCLTSTEKNELLKIWEDVFCSKATPMVYAEAHWRPSPFLMIRFDSAYPAMNFIIRTSPEEDIWWVF